MMVVGDIDLALIVLYTFWIFFAGLIFYLRREDRREGYPLESDTTGKLVDPGVIFVPDPKEFHLSDGTIRTAPHNMRDSRDIAGAPVAPWHGAPLDPLGEPMLSGIGPGAYAQRRDIADVDAEGHARIVPMRLLPDFNVVKQDADPRGLPVYGANRVQGGTVREIWVDRAEVLIRYLEIELLEPAGDTVLVPMPFVTLASGRRGRVTIPSITAAQLADVPRLKSGDSITLLEEEKVSAYYGGGLLYSTPAHKEPLI